MNKVMSIDTDKITHKKMGGLQMRKISIIIALALTVVMVMGISTAFAAPVGEVNPMSGQGPATLGENYTTGKEMNANQTGTVKNGLISLKNLEGQKVHGQYKANTNSCASCHMTHTAASKNLLFRSSTYNTCVACHDGSIGIYNVFSDPAALKTQIESLPDTGKAKWYTGGGTFSGTMAGNASMHLANGAVQLNAAPGGNRAAASGTWIGEFTCASCHAPHGSFSSRLLHFNPNGIASRLPAEGGLRMVDADLVVASAADRTALGIPAEVTTAYVAKVNNVLQTNPWINGQVTFSGGNAAADFNIFFNRAYVTVKDGVTFNTATKISAQRGIKARFTEVPNAAKPGETRITSYAGTASATADAPGLNQFCAACHTDYYQSTTAITMANGKTVGSQTQAANARGTFETGYRHNMKGLGCIECHYAHGSTAEIQLDAALNVGMSVDANPSSALKRFVNMSVCWHCHTSSKSTTFRQNDAFYDDAFGGSQYVLPKKSAN